MKNKGNNEVFSTPTAKTRDRISAILSWRKIIAVHQIDPPDNYLRDKNVSCLSAANRFSAKVWRQKWGHQSCQSQSFPGNKSFLGDPIDVEKIYQIVGMGLTRPGLAHCRHFMRFSDAINPFPPSVPRWHRLAKISVIFSFKGISKKGLFSFILCIFLLYNPNLKPVFCGRTYKYVF